MGQASLVSKAASLANFARQAGPLLWQRISADMKREVIAAPHIPQLKTWPKEGLHAAWIGHTTVALSLDGFTILTDPVFSTRIGINLLGMATVGLKRLVGPAVPLPEMPRPNLILLSHAHVDHFDLPSLRKLEAKSTSVVTAANTSDLLRVNKYGGVHELRWNESVQVGPATIRAFEVNHWGARMRNDTQRSYNGYLIDVGRYRVLFGGDTAYTDAFKSVRSSRTIDLAIMPIGAYDPWIRAHCNPEQALSMANDARAEFILPVHHQTFQLSNESKLEPIERLLTAAGRSADRVCLREIGQEFHLATA